MRKKQMREVKSSPSYDDWSYDSKIATIETRGDGLFSFGGKVISRNEMVDRLNVVKGDHSRCLTGFGKCMVTGHLLYLLLEQTRTPGVPYSLRVRKFVPEQAPASNYAKICSTYFKHDVRGFSGLPNCTLSSQIDHQ
jgi:hypothetical protein